MSNINETLRLLTIEAGGPGSGRKPGPAWSSKARKGDHSRLESYHRDFTGTYKMRYVGSQAMPKGAINHVYANKNKVGVIQEIADGRAGVHTQAITEYPRGMMPTTDKEIMKEGSRY